MAVALANTRTERAKLFLLERLGSHEDPEIRRAVIFSLAQAYGEPVRSSVASVARPTDLGAFDWVSDSDPDFDAKYRARFGH